MSWSDLPPLNTLVPFETTMRLGSLTKAAAELYVTHGAVSRQLKSLEDALGIELFRRDGRVLVPTAAAVEFNRQIVDSLGLLAAATRQARSSAQPRPLVLSCEPTLMMRWLLPQLGSLTASNPGLDVHLSAGGGPIDLRRTGVDVAIRRNDFDLDATVDALPLFPEWIGPVCAPHLATKIHEASDLAGLPQLVSATRPAAWDTWARLAGTTAPHASVQTFEHFYLSLEAASAGLGVAIGPYPLVANDLESGRLVAPLGFVEDGTRYVLLARSRTTDPRVIALYRWLRGNASATRPGPDRQDHKPS